MNFTTFTLQQEESVLRVTFNNAPINLMNALMVQELFQLAGHLQIDPSTKVVVFDSADPDFFIAHFDINDVLNSTGPEFAGVNPDLNAFQGLTLTWQMLPQVKIAKVDGRCRGGGLEFLMCLDMRFASTESKFCFPEASGGFVTGGSGATRAAMAMGPARVMELLLTSRDFNGEEAERYNLINRALPSAELDAYVEDVISRIAKRSQSVINMNRGVVNQVFQPFIEPMFSALALENEGLRAAIDSDEMQASTQALLKHGQTRESELDLPALIESLLPFVK